MGSLKIKMEQSVAPFLFMIWELVARISEA